jgi:aerobic-type carbon monoxide dehydrogenase small subunit (CoxS/CutS family)
VRFTLSVNGETREVDVPRRTTLLSALRDDLGLTATRYGCGAGQCGACFVLVDAGAGAPGRGATATPSCLMTVDQAQGLSIVTVEGLAQDGQLHPLQRAFAEEDAMQCGYCTSGILISAAALLSRDPHPNEAEIREALAPNLCRCGVYRRAIRAVQRAAGERA